MSKDTEKTIVVFRKWGKKNGGDVIAIFPFELGTNDPNTCSSYQHLGQHGAANDFEVVRATKLATAAEYAPLKAELEQIGYNLEIRRKLTPNAYESRKAQLKAIEDESKLNQTVHFTMHKQPGGFGF